MKIDKLEKAKEIIKDLYEMADCGIFNSRNIVGDKMINIYDWGGLIIDICVEYLYFEVFGLSDEEFKELKEYYDNDLFYMNLMKKKEN